MNGIRTVADYVRVHAADAADRLALAYVEDGREWTFGQLDSDSNRIAQALQAAGVGPQDRIAYLDKNAPEYFTYLFGGTKVGAVTVAVNWRLAPPEMQYILENSEAKVLLIGDEFLGHLAKMTLDPTIRVIVVGDPGSSGHARYEDWLQAHPAEDPGYVADAGETCYQLYTSGTTGLPKGVELTHSNFITANRNCYPKHRFGPDASNLVCMPLFHVAGSGWALVGMYHQSASILLRDVDLDVILETMPKRGITHSFFVPAVLQFLLSHPKCRDTDFSTLRSITYGASPITEAVLTDAIEVFECEFFQAYGLTETTGTITRLDPEDHDPGGPRAALLRSCGRPVPEHEIAIHDPESGARLGEGEVGEIWTRGPQVMHGYFKNPEATAKSIDAAGWFRTGDAGYLKDGYLYIHDRVKDMIISGGENIYPAEIENVLMSHPQIADAAVIGVPSERWGETVKAIITRADTVLTEAEVIDYCRERLAKYKCPTSVDWMETIPRNPSGKILKVELRKPYWEGQTRQVG